MNGRLGGWVDGWMDEAVGLKWGRNRGNQTIAERTGPLTSPSLSFPSGQKGRAPCCALPTSHLPTPVSVLPTFERGWGPDRRTSREPLGPP